MKHVILYLLLLLLFSCNYTINDLNEAIASANHAKVEKILNSNIDINQYIDNKNPIKIAIKLKDNLVIKLLIHHGVSLETLNNREFQYIINIINKDMLIDMINSNFDLSTKISNNQNFANWIIENKRIDLLTAITDSNYNLNSPVYNNTNILHAGFYTIPDDLAKKMIQKGLDINSKNNKNQNLLSRYLASGKIDMVKFLISSGVELKLTNNKSLGSWEYLARYWKDEYLFVADIFRNNNISPNEDSLVLHIACAFHHIELIKWLIQHNHNPTIQDKEGYYAEDYADNMLEDLYIENDKQVIEEFIKKSNSISQTIKDYRLNYQR